MKNLAAIVRPLILLIATSPALANGPGKPLTAKPGEDWVIRWNRSDDFNGDTVDWRKWHKVPEKFYAWSWDNEKNASVSNGILRITMRRSEAPASPEKAKGGSGKSDSSSPFSSGMLKSYAKGTYGYYEARIKAAPLFPGVSPAFWIYSPIDDSLVQPGSVRYSEVDFVEITQRKSLVEGNERITDHNLHAILSNGNQGRSGRDWRRPHDPRYKEAQANEYRTPFDPRADFHTYGCRVDRDTITWYVDGVEVGQKKNEYWHREMNVALSLGLRAPYAIFENNRLIARPGADDGNFPTSMLVDYVRVWELAKNPD